MVHIYRTVAYICKNGNKELVEKVVDIVDDLNKEIELLWHTESNAIEAMSCPNYVVVVEHTEDMNKSLDTLIWEYLKTSAKNCRYWSQAIHELVKMI